MFGNKESFLTLGIHDEIGLVVQQDYFVRNFDIFFSLLARSRKRPSKAQYSSGFLPMIWDMAMSRCYNRIEDTHATLQPRLATKEEKHAIHRCP